LNEQEAWSVFIALRDTSPGDVRWLTIHEGNSLNEVPSIAEWIAASCGVNSVDTSIRELLAGRNNLSELSSREMAQWEMLAKRSAERDSELGACKSKKIDNSRDAVIID
jgi:hypothetical protein